MAVDEGVDLRPEQAGKALKVIPPADLATIPVSAIPATQAVKQHWLKPALMLFVLILAATGGYWWLRPRATLPPGIASGNGRLEADEIDIDTKYTARIAKLFVDEGDLTKAGEVLVKMDTRDLEASLKKSLALIVQADQTLNAATATLRQQNSQVVFAQQEITRTQTLVGQGFATRETLDQQRQILNSALAGETAASAVIGQSQAARDAAMHDAELYQVEIADNLLVSPRDGRIEYRVANVGEVLPVGGKVFTMLDTSYVYMDVYMPTISAGRIKLGSEARIVVDSYPNHPLAAKVVFVAAQAQFTPKTVETQDERDLLMFRVRLRIDPQELANHTTDVRSGLPGAAYVQTSPGVVWPANLKGNEPT